MENIKMSEKINDVPVKDFKAEITSGDLLQLMTHAATREDIAKLDSKIDNKIDSLRSELKNEFDTKINRLSDKMDSNFKWTLGVIIVGILVPVALKFIN